MSKKVKIILGVIISIVLVAFILFAGLIGMAIGSNNQRSSYNDVALNEGAAIEGFSDKSVEDTESSFVSNEDEEQKLIYNGDVTIGTEDIGKSYKEVTEKIKSFDAKIESLNESSNSKYISIRVPKKNFFKFYNSLSDITGSITSSNMSAEDMTKEYKDNERRIDVLQTEYNELKELMKSAKNVKEVLQIKDRMSELTYEMEGLKGNNDVIDYDSKYSTLNLTLQKVGTISVESVPFGTELKQAFLRSIEGIKSLILGLVTIWWVIALIAGGVWFGFRKFRKEKKNADTIS